MHNAITSQSDTCTNRLKVYWPEPEAEPASNTCSMQYQDAGKWLSCGYFDSLEAAILRAKTVSELFAARIANKRFIHRLVDTNGKAFMHFDMINGQLFPTTAKTA